MPKAILSNLLSQLDFTQPTATYSLSELGSLFLTNFRGRPKVTISERYLTDEVASEELLYVKGKITFEVPADQDDNKEKPLPVEREFTLQLCTQFNNFRSRKIEYTITPHQSDALKLFIKQEPEIDLLGLLSSPRVSIDECRFGFETFKPSFLGPYLGSFPTINASLYLELKNNSFTLSSHYDGAQTTQTFPFESENYLLKTISALGISWTSFLAVFKNNFA